MVNAKRDSDAGSAGQLRRLAAALPSVDQALDELIARANRTEVAVGDEAVVEETLVDDPGGEPGTDPYLARRASDAALATDPTAPDHLNAYLAAAPADEDTTDAELLVTARTRDALTDATGRERALQREIATFVQKLDAADARGRAAKRRVWLSVVTAFAAGVVVMIAVSTWMDRAGGREPDARPAPQAQLPPPTVTPIEPAAPAPAAVTNTVATPAAIPNSATPNAAAATGTTNAAAATGTPNAAAATGTPSAAAATGTPNAATASGTPNAAAASGTRKAAPVTASGARPARAPAHKPTELADPFADAATPTPTPTPAAADAKPADAAAKPAKPAASLVNPF